MGLNVPPFLIWRSLVSVLLLLFSCLYSSGVIAAITDRELVAQFFPEHDGFGEFKGEPPVAEVFKGKQVITGCPFSFLSKKLRYF